MSSSKKKQLRKEQYMTERQTAAAKEAKKLKRYTLTFWVVLALVVSVFVGAIVSNPIKNVIYNSTVAMTVGDHKLSSVEVNYFFIDTVNQYVNENSAYISFLMDVTKPLDEQIISKETGTTWADSFLTSTQETIKSTYALYDLAVQNNHKLTEAEQKSIDSTLATYSLYAVYYGYDSLDAYLRSVYGSGAKEESYRTYLERSTLASSYLTAHSETLEYSAEDLLNHQAEEPYKYNSYSFATCYLKSDYFLTGGTTGEDGKVTYSDAEKAAALKAAKAAADQLANGTYATALAFELAIKELSINEEKTVVSMSSHDEVLYSELTTLFQDWLIGKVESEDENAKPTFEERKEDDMTVIPNTSGSGESEVVNGYYVVRFGSMTDNNFAMKNVRHVLITFEGGKTDSNGNTTYTDAEKEATKAKAEKLLADWVANGELTEESFADLAEEHSKDNAQNGGLYEDVYPGQMIENFDAWCYDENRKVGDYGIVEGTAGYHIMFFVGDSDTTFRDFMITNVLRNEELEKWHKELTDAIKLEVLTVKHIRTDLVLSH